MMDRRQFLVIAALGTAPLTFAGKKVSAEPKQRPAREPSRQLIVINPGHYRNSGENLGVHVPGIGDEYIINTQISGALDAKLRDIGFQAIVTRDEQNYIPEIVEFMADHKTRLESEYDAYIRAAKSRRRRELGRREALLQLGIMRFAEARKAAAMIDVHIDDQGPSRRKRKKEAKGFSVILNKTSSDESERLQRALCSALLEELPRNRCYRIKNARRGIFILGNDKLPFSVPSCLVECGFMRQQYTINGDQKRICDPEVQEIYAASLAGGLADYFRIAREGDI
jgi:N-acetylmuramoyl-L-alanine amidase